MGTSVYNAPQLATQRRLSRQRLSYCGRVALRVVPGGRRRRRHRVAQQPPVIHPPGLVLWLGEERVLHELVLRAQDVGG
eukprot:30838-Pelagococcus_subviridis.AAC.15